MLQCDMKFQYKKAVKWITEEVKRSFKERDTGPAEALGKLEASSARLKNLEVVAGATETVQNRIAGLKVHGPRRSIHSARRKMFKVVFATECAFDYALSGFHYKPSL